MTGVEYCESFDGYKVVLDELNLSETDVDTAVNNDRGTVGCLISTGYLSEKKTPFSFTYVLVTSFNQ